MTRKKLDNLAHNDFQISLPSLEFPKIIKKGYNKKHFVFKTEIVDFAIPVQKKSRDLLFHP